MSRAVQWLVFLLSPQDRERGVHVSLCVLCREGLVTQRFFTQAAAAAQDPAVVLAASIPVYPTPGPGAWWGAGEQAVLPGLLEHLPGVAGTAEPAQVAGAQPADVMENELVSGSHVLCVSLPK